MEHSFDDCSSVLETFPSGCWLWPIPVCGGSSGCRCFETYLFGGRAFLCSHQSSQAPPWGTVEFLVDRLILTGLAWCSGGVQRDAPSGVIIPGTVAEPASPAPRESRGFPPARWSRSRSQLSESPGPVPCAPLCGSFPSLVRFLHTHVLICALRSTDSLPLHPVNSSGLPGPLLQGPPPVSPPRVAAWKLGTPAGQWGGPEGFGSLHGALLGAVCTRVPLTPPWLLVSSSQSGCCPCPDRLQLL